ncbi:MAG TPA: hypothetical protein VJI98_03825 [Candidatus Nanoarchaeia archaeon]|nr:hypothetical protein [Candidatus Nanoarchaeia archaeon]
MKKDNRILAERLAQEDKFRILNARFNAITMMKNTYLQQFDPTKIGTTQIISQLDKLAIHYSCRYVTGELYLQPVTIKERVDPTIERHTEVFGELARERFDAYQRLYPWGDLVADGIKFDYWLSRVATAEALLILGGKDWIESFRDECTKTGINWLYKKKWTIHRNYDPVVERFYQDFFAAEAKSLEILQTN